MSSSADPSSSELSQTPVLDRFRLDGRAALVTGAGQGIGRAFAHALADAGAAVAVVDVDAGRAERVVDELQARGVDSLSVPGDVTAPALAERAVETVVDRWGALDIAVNNAGVNRTAPAEDTSAEDWDMHMDVNLRAVFLGCRAQAQAMLPRGYGKIVNTASMSSLIVPHPQKQAAYNASKAGVVQLSRSLAAEWADRGVRVNCISPGIVRTALIEESPDLRALVPEWVSQIPSGRLAELSDLQAAVVYLASEASDYVTGINLVIDGGQTLW